MARICEHSAKQPGTAGPPHRGRANGLHAIGRGATYGTGGQTGAAAGLHFVIGRTGGGGGAYAG